MEKELKVENKENIIDKDDNKKIIINKTTLENLEKEKYKKSKEKRNDKSEKDKDKNFSKIQNELNNKRKEIEKYYKDQIKILKEILAKEKKERDMEHRAYMIYLNQKEREQREEYKKQLNEIFEKFEEEERIQEYEDNNNPEIKRIFDAYYGS